MVHLQEALKTLIIDNGGDILNDIRKTRAYLGDYVGDDGRDELKQLIQIFDKSIHMEILNVKEFDDVEQTLYVTQTVNKYFLSTFSLSASLLNMLFEIFYDCNLIKRKTPKKTSTDILDSKMELWKKKLLDLGKRNRLLNYRDSKRSSLRLLEPGIMDIWNTVVKRGRSLEFPYVAETDDENDLISSPANRPVPRGVISNQKPTEQQKTLRNLKTKAKSILEEQGVNVLYLAFGFLNWKETKNANDIISSPLILVPVTITQKSLAAPFLIAISEDETVVNPTLQYKIENDFGIVFPDFDVDDDISAFFTEINNRISALQGWSVVSSVALSLFSFLKINMYNDLEVNKDRIKNHPIVKALCGNISGLVNPASINPVEYEHDKKHPSEIFQILDADSSQQDAIISAKNGLSFVLQGPPGTGKSQTIANIIGECLANDKKVLFVSEKVAALDVVYNRLNKAGVGDFCLSLHSHKSNKREMLDQLGATLNLTDSRSLPVGMSQFYAKLVNNRTLLDAYCKGLHNKVTNLQKSIFEIFGELAKLENTEDLKFNLEPIDSFTDEKYANTLLVLEEYVSTLNDSPAELKDNPWNGSTLSSITYQLQIDINDNLLKLESTLKDTIPLYSEIRTSLSLKVSNIGYIKSILEECGNANIIPVSWVDTTFIHETKKIITGAKTIITDLNKNIKLLSSSLDNIPFNNNLFSNDINTFKTKTEFLVELESFKSYVRNDELFGIWEQVFDFNNVRDLFSQLSQYINKYETEIQDVKDKYNKSVISLDIETLLHRFKSDKYNSIFRVFSSQPESVQKTAKVRNSRPFIPETDFSLS
jgi:hypothetical protein